MAGGSPGLPAGGAGRVTGKGKPGLWTRIKLTLEPWQNVLVVQVRPDVEVYGLLSVLGGEDMEEIIDLALPKDVHRPLVGWIRRPRALLLRTDRGVQEVVPVIGRHVVSRWQSAMPAMRINGGGVAAFVSLPV